VSILLESKLQAVRLLLGGTLFHYNLKRSPDFSLALSGNKRENVKTAESHQHVASLKAG